MHILYINRLAEEKYLKLVSQPNELIESLYMDDRIVKSANSVVLHLPGTTSIVISLEIIIIKEFSLQILIKQWTN